jgi:hypothetical protein
MRLVNGGGVSIKAWARWIEADGTSKIDGFGNDVELDFIHNADAITVDTYGIDALTRECLLAMLGEPLTLRDVPVGEGEEPLRMPILGWSDEFLLNVNIKVAIANANVATPLADAAGLLDL